MPDHYGFLTLSIQPFKRLDISITGTYTGEMFVAHFAGYIPQDKLEITPAFLDLNLAIAYTITLKSDLNLKLSAGIKNILNHYQTDFDKGSQRDANYIYGTMQPLTFFLSARFASN
jgi:outer membrane receptor for ferrienterochelin and colicins